MVDTSFNFWRHWYHLKYIEDTPFIKVGGKEGGVKWIPKITVSGRAYFEKNILTFDISNAILILDS